MERLTERYGDGYIAIKGCSTAYKGKERKGAPASNAIVRLAAYEDTGLDPEEIQRMKEYMKPFTIRDIDRFNEIMQAEKDGRLVVLPAKPDETVYQRKKGDDIPSLFRFDGVTINENGEIIYQTHWGETFKPEDFGKTVFLTREEAEAALKKREEVE